MSIAPETLSTFIPQLLIRHLVQQPNPPTASSQQFTAIALLADISGFTTLTEQLSQAGPEGVEILTHLLNGTFDTAISAVLERGGDVVSFAGDAFLALWPIESATGDSEVAALQAAAAAALNAQTQLKQFARAQNVEIALRIGIGSGEFEFSTVGGVGDSWSFVLSGASLLQLKRAIGLAKPGQVVLSAAVRSQLSPNWQGHPLEGGEYLLQSIQTESLPARQLSTERLPRRQPAPIPLETIRSFIPVTVLSRLEAEQKDWLAEFRQITAVFVRLAGWGSDRPFEQLQAIAVELQTTIKRYGGRLAFVVDDKGVSALVTLGLPLMAHDNDAELGVRAAFDIRQRLQDRGWAVAIGVATGRVFCGAIGNLRRREYTTIGGAVNLAARLMQAASKREAPHTILCDRTTYATVKQTFGWLTLPPIAVKGRTDLIPVYSPIASSTPAPQKEMPSLVGRERERTQLEEAIRRVADGERGGAIVLQGEAGIGKSRLMAEVQSLAEERGLEVLSGGGDSIEKQVSYRGWKSIFTRVLQLEERSPEEKRQRLLQSFPEGGDWRQRLPLLAPVLDIDIPESNVTLIMQGQVRADNTRELLLDILRDRLANRPALALLDDAHWMDSASWQFALAALQRLPNLLLVLATRPFEALPPDNYAAIAKSPHTLYLPLDVLDLQHTQQLLCQCLQTEGISERLLDLIYAKSQGQPLFSEQLALELQAEGRIERRTKVCDLAMTVGERFGLELPNTVRGAIVSRIDRLQPTQQLVLKTASAIGRVFWATVLQDIYPVRSQNSIIPPSLDALSQRRFTTLTAREPELTYQFLHPIAQEVAYGLMVFAQRRELHGAAATWYEQHSSEIECEPSVLAYHWERAEQWEKALDYLEQAGERALRNGANAEAVDFWQRAIAIADRQSLASSFRRARWYRQLGDAYVGLGNLSASCEALQTAISLLGRSLPQNTWAIAVGSLREAGVQFLRRNGLLPGRRRGKPGERIRHLKEMSLACSHLGEVYYYSNRRSLATFATLYGLNLAEQVGPSPELARIYANMCFTMGLNNAHWLSRLYARLALDTVRVAPQPTAAAWVNLVLGAYYSAVGHWESARQLSVRASEEFGRLLDRHRQGEALASLASIAHWQGNYPAAISFWRQTRQLGEQFGDLQAQLWGMLGEAEEHLIVGDWQSAIELVEGAREQGAHRQDLICEQFRTEALMAQVRLRQGQRSEARRLALLALELVEGAAAVALYIVESYCSIAAVLLELWWESPQDGQLGADARKACQAQARYASAFAIGRPRALLHRGVWNLVADRPQRARFLWSRCILGASRLRMPFEVTCAHWQLGRLGSGDREQQKAHFEVARRGFQSLGIDSAEKVILQGFRQELDSREL